MAPDAHVGQVKNLHIPAAPSAPEVLSTTSLSAALEEYASSNPSAVSVTGSTEPVQFKSEADEFLEEYVKPHQEEHGSGH